RQGISMRLPVFNRPVAMMGVALIGGLCAAWAAREHIQGRIRMLEAEARVKTVERVVAAYDLPAGIRLEPEHLASRSFPASTVSSDSLSPERYTELSGTILKTALRAGDPILPAHSSALATSAFSTQLVEGRRAITM